MFCPKCGAQNDSSSVFCCECGTKLSSNDPLREEMRTLNHRQQLKQLVGKLYGQFEGQKAAYDRLSEIQPKIQDAEEPLEVGTIFVGVALAAAALCIAISLFRGGAIVGATIVGAIGVVILALLIASPSLSRKNADALRRESADLYRGISEHYQSVPNNPIALDYCDPYSLSALYKIFDSGRADSLKEGIQVLEQIRYQDNVINLQQSLVDEVRRTRQAAQAAAIFAGVTAVNTGIAATRRFL